MIPKTYSTFFKELKQNNHKEWFHANKIRYENDVKIPFLNLLNAVIPKLMEWERKIDGDAKKALFRIHRDIRFAKDKSPYHTIMKAGFSPNGKKSKLPGYYLGIDAESVHVGGGLFGVETSELRKLRYAIAENPDTFLKIINDTRFLQKFGSLKGEKAKRLDKELMAAAEKTDVIFNRQFYAMATFPLAKFYDSEALVDDVLGYFATIQPLNAYLNNGLTSLNLFRNL